MAITYTRVNWQNNVTALNDQNLNQMEQGIVDTVSAINALGNLQQLKESAEQVTTIAHDLGQLDSLVHQYIDNDVAQFDASTGTLKLQRN